MLRLQTRELSNGTDGRSSYFETAPCLRGIGLLGWFGESAAAEDAPHLVDPQPYADGLSFHCLSSCMSSLIVRGPFGPKVGVQIYCFLLILLPVAMVVAICCARGANMEKKKLPDSSV